MTKAISIMQPWAWLIVNGHKDIENRTWKHSHRGETLVHTGLKLDEDAHVLLMLGLHPVTREKYPDAGQYQAAYITDQVRRGGFVGKVTIDDCVTESASPWFVGPVGFTLSGGAPLPFFPAKGKLGFYEAPEVGL